MKSKKLLAMGFAFVLAVTSLVGCGGNAPKIRREKKLLLLQIMRRMEEMSGC